MVDIIKMGYSTEPMYKKYVKSYEVCHLQDNLVKFMVKTNEYCKKTGIDAAKTASKIVLQKTPKATEDWIGNNNADKITLAGRKN